MPITGLVNLKNDDLSHEAAAACTLLMEVVVAPDPFELSHFDIRGEYIVQRAAAHFTTSTSTHIGLPFVILAALVLLKFIECLLSLL